MLKYHGEAWEIHWKMGLLALNRIYNLSQLRTIEQPTKIAQEGNGRDLRYFDRKFSTKPQTGTISLKMQPFPPLSRRSDG